jgi:crossover junction endodeoxyribonuclease RuvC
MVLGSARGAVIATLAELAIPMYEYAPRRVKQAVCGHGNASKEQVALLVSRILGISVANLGDDSTDALALCICHGNAAHGRGGFSLGELL